MSAGVVVTFVLVYGLALWLGLYLIGRDPHSPRLLLTGTGLLAYALAVACDLLAGVTGGDLAVALYRIRWPLLMLPALLWTGTLTYLLPEEVPFRRRVIRLWTMLVLPVMVLLLLAVGFGTDVAVGASVSTSDYGVARIVFGVAVLLPMIALGSLAWWSLRGGRERRVAGVWVVFTLFLVLSTALIFLPFEWLPRPWTLLAVGTDVICLGLAITYFDAFDLGEALLPDMIRSLDTALLAALIFGGQVTLAIRLATGPTPPMLALLLATITTATVASTLSDRLEAALDWLALGRLPRVRRSRSALRGTARALQRRDPALDPTKLDEDEFIRLTRRALSNFGDLPRLSSSPLINLPLVGRRLATRNAPNDPLERAAELKVLLSESIARLKPRTGADFGTSDEWRYYNALYFPYIVGLKPYSSRARTYQKDPVVREAREWFRDSVPERTLYNWQNAAAKLVACDLRTRDPRARDESHPG